MNPKALIWLLLAAAAYITILIYGTKAKDRSKAFQAQLEADFKALPPFPRATPLQYQASRKLEHAFVESTYATNATLPEIRAYYDSLLFTRGWRFTGEKPLRDWGRDLGGYSVYYTKDRFAASLQYAGKRANYGWDYAFNLSWGLH